MKTKIGRRGLFVMLCALLLVSASVLGTWAYLTATTLAKENTFTYGNIGLTLDESTGENYKIIPGVDIDKDPTVKVAANSEACWLFVKVEKKGEFLPGVSYEIDDAEWTALPGEDGVYYREVTASENEQTFSVLKGDKITVSTDITSTQIANLTGDDVHPELKFTAYAVQQATVDTAAAAWAIANA
jgi:predicted ribosomally synthesized peptide with SipW-like signal peptide